MEDGADAAEPTAAFASSRCSRCSAISKATREEHFGFADGGSDPTIDPASCAVYPNQIHLGELLLGYENEADWPPGCRATRNRRSPADSSGRRTAAFLSSASSPRMSRR